MSSKPALTDEEIKTLEKLLTKLSGSGADLPPPLFRFISEVAAVPNVDLLVHDEEKGVMLAWREDPFGAGWHVPGSIIRHRETIAHRILACAEDEFGCDLSVVDSPVAVLELFDERGHNFGLCYPAKLAGTPRRRIVDASADPAVGDLRWFQAMPEDLYPPHHIYREIVEAFGRGELDGVRVFATHVGARDAAQISRAGAIDDDALG